MAKKELMGIKDFIEEVIKASGYIESLKKEDTIESQTRLENIQEFISVAMDFELRTGESNLEEFLANIALLSDVDKTSDSTDVVTMMTIHSSKGLEFPVVFTVGMEEGLFPTFRALDNESDLEEERRLCYVAVTRAEKLLFITSAKIRTIYGKTNYSLPSRFIREMGDSLEHVEKDSFKEKLVQVKDLPTKKTPPTIPGIPFIVQGPKKPERNVNAETSNINLGDKVKHNKWGIGTVVQVKNRDDGDKELTIAFDTEGLKRVLQSLAPLEVVR